MEGKDLNPNRSLGRHYSIEGFYWRRFYVISAFLSASFPPLHLAVARYAFDEEARKLLETNTNLTQILLTIWVKPVESGACREETHQFLQTIKKTIYNGKEDY